VSGSWAITGVMTEADEQLRRTVLVVEDEATMATVLRYNLEREGYRCLVAPDGARAIELAPRERPDLILLDLMLPGIDGIEVCRRIRSRSNVPIIMLTARVDEVDRVVGLEVGADDYVTKPFSMRELLARVRAGLRRAEMRTAHEPSLIPLMPGLTIDPNRRQVLRDGHPVPMKPKEFDLLHFLARHPRQVFTRERLLDQVWGYEFAGQTRTVDVHVRWLREKIEPDPANPAYLLTNRGVGYRLEPRVGGGSAHQGDIQIALAGASGH
jgi:DNA-binding response OmpR family regulator